MNSNNDYTSHRNATMTSNNHENVLIKIEKAIKSNEIEMSEYQLIMKIVRSIVKEWLDNDLIERIMTLSLDKPRIEVKFNNMATEVSIPEFTGKSGTKNRRISVFACVQINNAIKELLQGSNGQIQDMVAKTHKNIPYQSMLVKSDTYVDLM